MNTARPARISRGFTLIELLTVIAIIGILAGILIPVVGSVRQKARMTQSMSNLRQLGSAAQIFIADNKQTLPVNSTTHTTHYWYRELWKILYTNRTVPSMPPVPDNSDRFREVFGDTVFHTPLMEEGSVVRSYGYNRYLSQYTTAGAVTDPATPLNFSHVANPSRTALLGDSGSINFDRGNAKPRNDGFVFVTFVDGHVEKLLPPLSSSTNPAAERRIPYVEGTTFWRGVARSPTGTQLAIW